MAHNTTFMLPNDSNTILTDVWVQEELRNFRDRLFTFRQPTNIALISLYVPVFLLALLGNLLVVVVILAHRDMRNVTNYLLLNLAVADLLVTLMCIPLTVGKLVYRVWIYGHILCKISVYMQGLCVGASVLTIMVLSLDRYIVIRHPVKARSISTTSHVLTAILVIWVLAASIMVPLAVIPTMDPLHLPDGSVLLICHEEWPSLAAKRGFDIFLFVFIYMIPGVVVVVCYSSTGCRLMQVPLQRQESDVYKSTRIIAGRRRAALMLLAVALLFAISWLPYHAVSLHAVLGSQAETNEMLVPHSFALLLGHSHSAQNPVIYYLMNNQFRVKLRAIIKCQRAPMSTDSITERSRQPAAHVSTDERTRGSRRNGSMDYRLMKSPQLLTGSNSPSTSLSPHMHLPLTEVDPINDVDKSPVES